MHDSDRAWWPGVLEDLGGSDFGPGNVVAQTIPASQDSFAGAVTAACGARLVANSVVAEITGAQDPAAVDHLYFLDRRGHALLYFEVA